MNIYVVGSSIKTFSGLDSNRTKFLVDRPHSGDNIDYLNPWYCELTGLYHMWKNCDDEIVGLEHYRRYFTGRQNDPMDEEIAKMLLANHDVICVKAPYPENVPIVSWIKNNYKYADFQKFLEFARLVAGQKYYDACRAHLNGHWHCLGNLFVAPKEFCDEYCKFIFGLLERYRDAEHRFGRELPPRICGYFSEFLMGSYLMTFAKKPRFGRCRIVL